MIRPGCVMIGAGVLIVAICIVIAIGAGALRRWNVGSALPGISTAHKAVVRLIVLIHGAICHRRLIVSVVSALDLATVSGLLIAIGRVINES